MYQSVPASVLDDMDRRILLELIRNPGLAIAALARNVDSHTPTIQKRVAKLLRSGCIRRDIRIIDWLAAGFALRYRIEINVNLRDLYKGHTGPEGVKIDNHQALARYIATNLPRRDRDRLLVEDVTILLGSKVDLCVTVRARDHQSVFDFITNDLRLLGGIESTQTYHEAWSYLDGDR